MRRHAKRWGVVLGAIVGVAVGATSARAQAPAAEVFEPQAVEQTSIWSTATSEVAGHLEPHAVVVAHYADDPIELRRRADGGAVARIIDDQYKVEFGLGVGLFDRVELGLVLPLAAYQSGEASPALPTATTPALADARGQLRVQAFQIGGFGLGAQLTGYLPASAHAAYQSNGQFSALGSLVADYQGASAWPWRIATNVGWAFQPEVRDRLFPSDDQLDVRVGAEVQVWPDVLHLMASASGRWQALSEPPDSISGGYLGGARVFWGGSGWTSTIGAGGGIGGGYGTPDLRVVASMGYRPSTGPRDQDGAATASARCPDGREDVDGFQDADGCADPDNDRDGIADGDDACPNTPEDADGFEDTDGCPESDNDGDGVADFDDACPDQTGRPEESGCPFVDDDGDGIGASVDSCPDAAEDIDQFKDADGCPDGDNDGDGIADGADQCPDIAESINGVDDGDGCPDEGDSAVRLAGDQIEILKRVHFDTARSSIKQTSHSVLEQLAAVLKSHPDIELLRIQGHTDDRGEARSNLELSQQRAVSVKEFLVDRGIDPGRLSARGYGQTHPIADNDSRSGRAKNRRVEFHIIKRSNQH